MTKLKDPNRTHYLFFSKLSWEVLTYSDSCYHWKSKRFSTSPTYHLQNPLVSTNSPFPSSLLKSFINLSFQRTLGLPSSLVSIWSFFQILLTFIFVNFIFTSSICPSHLNLLLLISYMISGHLNSLQVPYLIKFSTSKIPVLDHKSFLKL